MSESLLQEHIELLKKQIELQDGAERSLVL